MNDVKVVFCVCLVTGTDTATPAGHYSDEGGVQVTAGNDDDNDARSRISGARPPEASITTSGRSVLSLPSACN